MLPIHDVHQSEYEVLPIHDVENVWFLIHASQMTYLFSTNLVLIMLQEGNLMQLDIYGTF